VDSNLPIPMQLKRTDTAHIYVKIFLQAILNLLWNFYYYFSLRYVVSRSSASTLKRFKACHGPWPVSNGENTQPRPCTRHRFFCNRCYKKRLSLFL